MTLPFQILGEVGRGAFGVVVRARAADGSELALKTLSNPSPERLARFERERQVLAELGDDAGFVPLLDVGHGPHGPFLVMPFLSGGTLRQRLEQGPFDVDDALEFGLHLATALGRAHARGIVHRDLKPDNVLFTARGEPRIADLGLAKHWGQSGVTLSLSLTGDFRGTAGYMAPEQMADAKSAGPAADVFALGAILYECLTGQPAFSGESPVEVIASARHREPTPIRSLRPEVPRWLVAVLRRAMAKSVDARYDDGAALAAALAAGPQGQRGERRLIAVLSVVALAVFGAGALVATQRRGGQPDVPLASRESKTPEPVPTGPLGPTGSSPLPSEPPGADPSATAPRTDPPTSGSVGPPASGSAGPPASGSAGPPTSGSAPPAVEPPVSALLAAGPSVTQAPQPSSPVRETQPVPGAAGSPALARDLGAAKRLELRAVLGRTRWIHSGAVLGLARFGDEGVLATDNHGVLRVWSPTDGQELRTLEVFPANQAIAVLAVSPDGTRGLVSSGQLVRLYDLALGKPLLDLNGHAAAVLSLAWSRDGAKCATGDESGRTYVWELARQPEPVGDLRADSPVTGLAFAADGGSVTTCHGNGALVSWTLGKTEVRWNVKVHPATASALAISPDGALGASVGDDGLALWKVESGELLRRVAPAQGVPRWLCFLPDGRLAVSSDNGVTVHGMPEGAPQLVLQLPPDSRHAFTTSRDGARIYVGVGQRIATVDVPSKAALPLDAEGHGGWVVGLEVRPADGRPHSAGFDASIRAWDGATLQGRVEHPAPSLCAALAPDSKTLAVVDFTGALYFLDAGGAALGPRTVTKFEEPVSAIAFRDAERLYVGDAKGRVCLFDPAHQGTLEATQAGAERVTGVAVVPGSGRVLVWTNEDKGARLSLFEPDLKHVVWGVPANRGRGTALCVLPGGERAATADQAGRLQVWDLSDGRCEWERALGSEATALCASPDGGTLFVGGFGRTLASYATADGAELEVVPLATSLDIVTCLRWDRGRDELLAGTARGLIVRLGWR